MRRRRGRLIHRRLAVDADIGRAAGERLAADATGLTCLTFLQTITACEHLLAFSDELYIQWLEHASRSGMGWLATMRSRGMFVPVGRVADRSFRASLRHHANSEAQKRRMLEDAHLVETARCADRLIASRDETVRHDFRQHAGVLTWVANVAWVNPTIEGEGALKWLEDGAPVEEFRTLGFRPEA